MLAPQRPHGDQRVLDLAECPPERQLERQEHLPFVLGPVAALHGVRAADEDRQREEGAHAYGADWTSFSTA